MGVCNCSIFCCTLLYVHSSIAIILMGKRELVALLYLSSWCLVMVEWLFLAVPWGCLRFVIVVFPDHTHYFRYNNKLECAVNWAPSQIPMLKFLTPQHPKSHPLGMTPATEWKLCSICFLSFICENTHTKFGIKIFEIDMVTQI